MPGSNRAIFLDRDGTLVEDPGYLTQPEQLKLLPGAAHAIARLRRAGFLVLLATNQSAIARGLMTEDDLTRVHLRLGELLAQADPQAKLDGVYFCPFHPEASVAAYRQESYLRKPRPGMLFKAAREHQLDLGSCWMIGDSERDVQAGKTAGCRAIRIGADPETDTAADRVMPSLAAAAELVLSSPGRTPLRSAKHGEPAAVHQAEIPTVVEPAVETTDDTAVVEAAEPAADAGELAAAIAPAPDAESEPRPVAQDQPIVEPEPAPVLAAADASAGGDPPAIDQPAVEAPMTEPTGPANSPQSVPTAKDAAPRSTPGRLNEVSDEITRLSRPLGSTRERLLREIEMDRQRALSGEPPAAKPEPKPAEPAAEPPPDNPAKSDAAGASPVARPLGASDMRHVLAEILQQLRQLNRGPNKHELSATRILGGLFLVVSFALFGKAMVALYGAGGAQGRGFDALVWVVAAVFVQLISLTFFLMHRQE